VEIDAASNRGVDDARELRERAMYAPSGERRYKVYIVDEAHMLTREAWNALLKILEEPPPRVVFVFATTEPQKIAQAAAPVLSRLQRFDFRRIGTADIKARLTSVLAEEGITAEADALGMIARAADGSMRDALSLTDQALSLGEGALTATRVREALGLVPEDEFLAMLDIIAEHRAGDVFERVDRLAQAGIDFGAFLGGFADLLRAQLAIALGARAVDVSDHTRAALEARAPRIPASDLLRMLQAVADIEPNFRKSGQQRLLTEALLVRLALLDRSVAIESVLEALGGSRPGEAARPSVTPVERRSAPPERASDAAAPPSHAALEPPPALPDATPPPPRRPPPLPDGDQLARRWPEVIEHLRASKRQLLASMLEHSEPVGITTAGVVSIRPTDEPTATALENGKAEVVASLREVFPAINGMVVARGEPVSASAPTPRRLTERTVREEKIAALKKRDPVLGAAIEELDLDLME
jgi:DNA polymerase-3 subunit gamma/tau